MIIFVLIYKLLNNQHLNVSKGTDKCGNDYILSFLCLLIRTHNMESL